MLTPQHLTVTRRVDVERARREARTLATTLRFSVADAEHVVLAVSELATNLVRYAQGGEIVLSSVDGPRGIGIQVESRDLGPGIANVGQALEDGFSTGGGLGSGLPATQRSMDEFAIATDSNGTRIVARKWATSR